MFIKSLIISTPDKVIRKISFNLGLNLIVDNTPTNETQLTTTGNNVGKTTVLKLIDFCLGAKPANIYTETENSKSIYDLVRNYLINSEVFITLTLTNDLNDAKAEDITIKRNFLSGKKAILRINEKDVLQKDFELELLKLLIPDQKNEKPTFRQIISHNIRYRDESINQTLKTLNRFTTDLEYESLYLFLLDCPFNDAAAKQTLISKISQEDTFKDRLEKKQPKAAYQQALVIIEDEIQALTDQKDVFKVNEYFETDLESFNTVKYKINKCSSTISQLNIRKELIEQAQKELAENASTIDLEQLKVIYQEATSNISGIQKTFEQLVHYHNNMLEEKVKFISEDLPLIIEKIKNEETILDELLTQEKQLSLKVKKSVSFNDYENVINELNNKYRDKGELESVISQLNDIESNIKKYNEELEDISNLMFSDTFVEKVKTQVGKFNKFFSSVSKELYGESYLLYDNLEINKKNQKFYKFSTFNANMSSGKKQGEILCFDLAYTFFADAESKSCLHFLLNDKKELMHDNQLIKMTDYVKDKNVQVIISILKDKVPEKILQNTHIAIELSPNDKLFRIEQKDNFTV